MLILYLATLLKVFVWSNSLLGVCLWSFKYRMISSANRDNLSFFHICFHLFLSLALLLWLRIQKLLNKNGNSEHPCLIPDFSGYAFSFSPLSIMCAILAIFIIAFIMLRYTPSIPHFFRFLLWRMLDFVKGFFCIYWDVLASIYGLCYIYQFAYVGPSLHSWNEANLIMMYDF
jgi:hypothetical protein